jgi:atypical dual specificity phosphatase
MRSLSFVIPDELAGEADSGADGALDELRRLGFRSLLSLGERASSSEGVKPWVHLHCPFPSSGRIAPVDVHRAAAFLEHAPKPIVVRCEDGLGRTGVALAAGLIARGRGGAEALEEVRRARPGSLGHPDLEESVMDYALFRRQGIRTAWFNFAPASSFDDLVYGGERPPRPQVGDPRDLAEEWSNFMVRQGIGGIICLLHEAQLTGYPQPLLDRHRRSFRRVTHVPIEDFSVPTLEGLRRALEALRQAEIEGTPTLVHCVAGMGRTGIVLAGWLRARYGLGVDDAIAEVRGHAKHFGAFRNPVEAGDEVIPLLAGIVPGSLGVAST